jgi:LacI family transcriptional regulator
MDSSKEKHSSRNLPATAADVARHAGVSPMTVSRVVNGEKWVKQETRDRVNAAIAALKYMPNQEARRLAGAEAIRVGVLYSNPSAGYLSEFLVGLLNEATRNQVHLMVEWVDPQLGVDAVDAFLSSGLEAVIVAPPLGDWLELVDRVVAKGLSAVLVAPGKPDPRLSAVAVDHYAASMRMTRHLVSLGHQRIGFITGRASHSAAGCRLSGFRDAMAQAGLELPDQLVVSGAFNYSSGLTAAEELLLLDPRPTAIFASNDDMAAATVAVAHRMGLDVPADLTVVGCDDTAIATTIWPELTTIRQPIRLMAARSVDLIVRQLKTARAGKKVAQEVLDMTSELIRRQSDAAPRLRLLAKSRRDVLASE